MKFDHKENDFDDFDYQILLPHKMSQFGPALASADINADGLDDIYIGGASGFEPIVMIQGEGGEFTKINTEFWKKEPPYEDVDAIFLMLMETEQRIYMWLVVVMNMQKMIFIM